jgi:hypothetical protein
MGIPMDTMTHRNLEKLLRLMDINAVQIEGTIEVRDGSAWHFIEVREDHEVRVALSAKLAVDEPCARRVLEMVLARWSPAWSGGVPLRAFFAEGGIFVSALMPADSSAEAWYRMVRLQRRLLETCALEQV